MKILAIDTTTKFLTLAVYNDGKVGEYNLETGKKLSVLLALTIKKVVEAAGINLAEVDYFAAGIGPGSFTGIRLGLSAVKGLSYALNKPVIGFSTLDILAMNAPAGDKMIIPVIDAKRSLIYSCVYKYKNGRLTKLAPYALLAKEELYKKIKLPSLIFGDALNIYRDDIACNTSGVEFLDRDCWYPKAHNIITLALEKIKGHKFNKNFKLNPIYLYPKECQVRRASVERIA